MEAKAVIGVAAAAVGSGQGEGMPEMVGRAGPGGKTGQDVESDTGTAETVLVGGTDQAGTTELQCATEQAALSYKDGLNHPRRR
jgi:hypothetical protein